MPSWYPGRPYKPASIDSVEDDYSKEIPAIKKSKSAIDDWLNNNIVEPMANAGHGDIGAAMATVPSTIAEFMAPSTPGDFSPGMAGVGKLSRKGQKISKDILNEIKNNPNFKNKVQELYYKVSNEVGDMANKNAPYDEWKTKRSLQDYLREVLNYIRNPDISNTSVVKANSPNARKSLNNQINNLKIADLEENDDAAFKAINEIKKRNFDIGRLGQGAIDAGERLGISPKSEYLRPKGYAKQPKMVKPELTQSPIQTREQYDEMLRGKIPGKEYFDTMGDDYRKFLEDQQDEPDFFKDYIKNSWKGK